MAKTMQEGSRLDAVLDAVDRQEPDPERNIRVQLEEGIARAVQAAKASGDPAKVTLTIRVVPDQGSRVTLFAKCEERLPKPSTPGVTLFTDADGNLLDADPKQTAMDLTGKTKTTRNTQEN